MRRAPSLVPAMLRFSPELARQDAWGRLLRLTPGGAELSTSARVSRGETVELAFELGGERFEGLLARVIHAEDDQDGHRLAELRWTDERQRRALAKALLGLLARS